MNPRALRTALLAGKRRPRLIGAGSPTQFRGDGYEFVELREYVPGDDPRRIDWAATARSGELQTRVVLEDIALTLAAVVDDSGSMRVGRSRELRDAAHEAARAWFECALAGDRCISVRHDGILTGAAATARQREAAPPVMPSRRSEAAPYRGTSVPAASDLVTALTVAPATLPRGAALLLITDAFDLRGDHDDLLGSLAARFDCTVLLARDPWRDGFPMRGLTRIRDAESGKSQTVFLSAGRAVRIAHAVRQREAQLRRRFGRAGWRVGELLERDGAASLYAAFGFETTFGRPRM